MPSVHQHSFSFDGDAFRLFSIFKDQPQAFFLDSSLRNPAARFSYMGFVPFKTVKGGLADLKREFNKHCIRRHDLTFPAGAVGYLGYDGSVYFGFYDTILCVDHQQRRLIISSFSKGRVKDVTNMCHGREAKPPEQSFYGSSFTIQSNFTKPAYIKAVRQALGHIRRGDIYQINLSHQLRFKAPAWRQHLHPVGVYQHLRQSFPSEFGAYIDDGKQVILSASPERFLKLHDRTVEVKPMKGTRPRGRTKLQDKKLKEELKGSPKEIAELLMVTDLERNDLGRVCDYKTIKVSSMRAIETYASVFQATSTVQGRLRQDRDQFDLLQATFPSGSVTGCPKIEAMKIIKKLEHGSRGLYTGALGYISFAGDMDFNVMIRTMFLKRHDITFHVGGGIVADSEPEAEWQETWDKARPLIETLKKSFS